MDKLQIGRGIDNISFSNTTGLFWITRHFSLFELAKHKNNVDNLSAYEVITVDYRTKGLKVMIKGDGKVISGASAAVIHKDRLYLGAVCDDVLLELTVSH